MRRDQATIYLFQTQTHAVRVLRGHEGYVLRMAFAPALEGKPPLLVSAAQEPAKRPDELVGRLCLWDVSKAAYRDDQGALVDVGALLRQKTLDLRPRANLGLAVRHAGRGPQQVRVAIAWSDGRLRIWDSVRDELTDAADGLPEWNNMASWTSGSEVLTGSVVQEDRFTGGRLQIWYDAPGQKPEARLTRALQAPEGYKLVLPRALALFAARPGGGPSHAAVIARVQAGANADEYWLLTIELAGLKVQNVIYLWERSAGEPVLAATGAGRHVAVAGRNDHAVLVYEVASLLRAENKKQTLHSVGMTARSVSFLEKGKELALFLSETPPVKDGGTAGMKESDLVFDPARRTITADPGQQGWKFTSPSQDGWEVQSSVRDESSGASPARTRIDWQGPNARGQVNLELGAKESITARALAPPSKFSPGPILAVASWDREVSQASLRLIDADTSMQLRQLTSHTRPITGLAASRDGKLLVSAAEDQTVCIWSLTDLARIRGQHGTLDGIVLKPATGGLAVESAKSGRPADSKLEPGDVIEGLLPAQGGKVRSFTSVWELYEALWDQKPGKDVDLQVQRAGTTRSVSIRVAAAVAFRDAGRAGAAARLDRLDPDRPLRFEQRPGRALSRLAVQSQATGRAGEVCLCRGLPQSVPRSQALEAAPCPRRYPRGAARAQDARSQAWPGHGRPSPRSGSGCG
ncbi:MAG: PDZ domain-containing protein [Planctomycetota bacterium]|nr:MAG: PDZ domain-containing protein [Planctomycetota bacterium]